MHDMSNFRFLKKMLAPGLLCLAALYSANAQAACTFTAGSGFGPNDGETISFGNVVAQRDVPLGSTLATISSTKYSNRGNFITCGGIQLTSRWSVAGLTAVTYNGEQLFSVGIAGVALRVLTPASGYAAYKGFFSRDFISNGCLGTADYSTFCGAMWGGPTTFQLVKIGGTGSGAITIPGSVDASLVNLTYTYHFKFASSTFSTVACSVTNTAIPVPLGEVKLSEFTGTGSTPGAKGFNIALNCNVGTKINVTVAGNADSSGIPGVLALTPSSTTTVAQGVGLQLLRNSVPVTLGAPIAVGTVTSAGAYNIPLIARYYQTATTVKPGLANSSATFTMTYN